MEILNNLNILSISFGKNVFSLTKLYFKKLVLIIPIIFIVELIIGFNGKLLVVGNIPIRRLLFVFTAFLLLIMTIFAIMKEQIALFDLKSDKCIFRLLDKFDYSLAVFILLNSIWVFLIPYFSGYGIKMATKEVFSCTMLFLYYPLIILIRLNYVDWSKQHKLIKQCLFILAGIHIFLYIGEIIVDEASFSLYFFKFIEKITFGHSQRPLVMMPSFCIRIMYPCAIFFIVMVYYVLKSDLSKKYILFYVVALTAVFTTLMKSLLFGICGGMLFYFIYFIIAGRKYLGMYNYRNISKLIIITIVSSVFLNYIMFDGYVFIRVTNSFAVVTEQPPKEIKLDKYYLDKNDLKVAEELAGTQRANFTRLDQTKKILTKWLKRPLLGFGYGSYVEDYLRSDEESPYSYEMFFPSMLMKIGILGMLVWIIFLIYTIRYIIEKLGWRNKNAIAVLYIIIALGISVQFNPFLFNSSGMSIVLFCFIEIKHMMINEKNQVA